ncbi:unnamed protein product [Vitrella brassicaformis CCMP3155]|uniref:PPM-type phosphatase domain-containing protein n=1 Tax=Vitrella brassicaformis (strain CCMP3155) TaxID=1169540 RepID=A0A0G4FNY1_VITBC|nr:unnamed protein product [Vitrella brassicaformis CCMP3155]|eukprot:CEM15772.1 unnamed protein product [Vitrella brassicaformis CCMP3155]
MLAGWEDTVADGPKGSTTATIVKLVEQDGGVFAHLATFGDSVAAVTCLDDLDEGTIEGQLLPMQLPGHWKCPFQLAKLCGPKAREWRVTTSDGRRCIVDPLPDRLRSLPANKPPFWTPTGPRSGYWSAGVQTLEVAVQEGDVIIAATDGVFDNILIDVVVRRADDMWRMTAAKLAREIGELAYNTSVDRTAPTPFAREARIHNPKDPDFRDGRGGKRDDITVVVGVVRSPGQESETVCDPYGEAAEDAELEEDLSLPSVASPSLPSGALHPESPNQHLTCREAGEDRHIDIDAPVHVDLDTEPRRLSWWEEMEAEGGEAMSPHGPIGGEEHVYHPTAQQPEGQQVAGHTPPPSLQQLSDMEAGEGEGPASSQRGSVEGSGGGVQYRPPHPVSRDLMPDSEDLLPPVVPPGLPVSRDLSQQRNGASIAPEQPQTFEQAPTLVQPDVAHEEEEEDLPPPVVLPDHPPQQEAPQQLSEEARGNGEIHDMERALNGAQQPDQLRLIQDVGGVSDIQEGPPRLIQPPQEEEQYAQEEDYAGLQEEIEAQAQQLLQHEEELEGPAGEAAEEEEEGYQGEDEEQVEYRDDASANLHLTCREAGEDRHIDIDAPRHLAAPVHVDLDTEGGVDVRIGGEEGQQVAGHTPPPSLQQLSDMEAGEGEGPASSQRASVEGGAGGVQYPPPHLVSRDLMPDSEDLLPPVVPPGLPVSRDLSQQRNGASVAPEQPQTFEQAPTLVQPDVAHEEDKDLLPPVLLVPDHPPSQEAPQQLSEEARGNGEIHDMERALNGAQQPDQLRLIQDVGGVSDVQEGPPRLIQPPQEEEQYTQVKGEQEEAGAAAAAAGGMQYGARLDQEEDYADLQEEIEAQAQQLLQHEEELEGPAGEAAEEEVGYQGEDEEQVEYRDDAIAQPLDIGEGAGRFDEEEEAYQGDEEEEEEEDYAGLQEEIEAQVDPEEMQQLDDVEDEAAAAATAEREGCEGFPSPEPAIPPAAEYESNSARLAVVTAEVAAMEVELALLTHAHENRNLHDHDDLTRWRQEALSTELAREVRELDDAAELARLRADIEREERAGGDIAVAVDGIDKEIEAVRQEEARMQAEQEELDRLIEAEKARTAEVNRDLHFESAREHELTAQRQKDAEEERERQRDPHYLLSLICGGGQSSSAAAVGVDGSGDGPQDTLEYEMLHGLAQHFRSRSAVAPPPHPHPPAHPPPPSHPPPSHPGHHHGHHPGRPEGQQPVESVRVDAVPLCADG